MFRRSQFGTALSCLAVAFSGGVTAAIPSAPSVARDYSFHILAHVSTRCSIYRAPLGIELMEVAAGSGGGHVFRGDGGFRVACNVPYAFDVHRVSRRGVFGSTAAIAAVHAPVATSNAAPFDAPEVHDLALTVTLAGRDGPLEGLCLASELAAGAAACTPFSSPDDPRLGAPQAMVRLALVAGADMRGDGGAAVVSGATHSKTDQAMARPARAQGLRIVVQPRH